MDERKNSFTVIDKLTGEYPDLENIALHEEWAKGLVYCDMEGFALEEDGSLLLLDECDNSRYCPPNRFEIIWNTAGHWIVLDNCSNSGIYCSECQAKIFDFTHKPKDKISQFCPHCGAKMAEFRTSAE